MVSESVTIDPDYICVRVTNRFTGQSKTMKDSEISLIPVALKDAIPDKKRTKATKQLFDSDIVKELYQVQLKLRAVLNKKCTRSSLGDSVYAIKREGVAMVQGEINEAEAQLQAAKDNVKAAYTDIVEAQKKGLGDLFNINDYPPVDEFLSTFSIESRWIQIGVPPDLEEVNSDIFKEEIAKAEKDVGEFANQTRQMIRGEFMEIMDSFRGMISGDSKKQFNAKTAKKLREFVANFNFRDLTNDDQLKGIMHEMADVVSGLDAKALRNNEALRDAFKLATQEVLEDAAKLVENKPKRRIDLD